jgi:transposase InsO family protein
MPRVKSQSSHIPLPSGWNETVRSAVLHVIALARFAAVTTRSWAANSPCERVRLKAENDRLRHENALLREEIRIKDIRMEQIETQRRPHYPPTERLAILEVKAARGWSLKQTAKAFLITAATVASWLRRVDDVGPEALVQLPQPINQFPQWVGHAVQRLKTLCLSMGKVKIAQTLARAGLHLGVTTVGRMLKDGAGGQPPRPTQDRDPSMGEIQGKPRVVTAKYPGHVWHVDLTLVPTGLGFWCSWLPFALPQQWPFCWWLAVAVDHFSRRAMGVAVFPQQPTSEAVRGFLGRTIARTKKTPKYLICDRGRQFDCQGFRDWCRRKRIKPPRYGAIGKHGSIAVVERFILTLKGLLSCLLLVPYRREAFLREVEAIRDWYNQHRPHTWLGGRTPEEVYQGRFPAHRRPRFEPRPAWPRGSPCAQPWALIKGRQGARLHVQVTYHGGRKHLPIVTLRRAA